jgi:hypothetical protein
MCRLDISKSIYEKTKPIFERKEEEIIKVFIKT